MVKNGRELAGAAHGRANDATLTNEELMDRNLGDLARRSTDTDKGPAGHKRLEKL